MKQTTNENLIAPCGMNCSLCSSYLAYKNDVRDKDLRMPYCTGCRIRDKKCSFLKKQCNLLLNNKVKYCFECKKYPCDRLKQIDERYRTHFKMSLIENLDHIKEKGIIKFIKEQEEKWKCDSCQEQVCCHNGLCYSCDIKKLKSKKNKYRWEE